MSDKVTHAGQPIVKIQASAWIAGSRERDRLRAEVKRLDDNIAVLEAENERLREVLLGIAESDWTLPEAYQVAVIFQRMARAALGHK